MILSKVVEMKSKILYLLIVFIFAASGWATESYAVQLLSERHRTEWNWVEYRISLKNTSNKPIRNPEIRYFAENPYIDYCELHPQDAKCSNAEFGIVPIDSSLAVDVDYVSGSYRVDKSVQPGEKYSVISLKIKGKINPTKNVKIHFRIHKKQWDAWSCSKDFSYQRTAAVQEPHYFMAVLDDASNVLWGSDPVLFKHDTTNVYWSDRNGRRVVSQYDGNSNDTISSGRFWMLKSSPLSLKERNSIDTAKLQLLDGTRYQNRSLYLFLGKKTFRKKELDSTFNGIFDAFAANDTTPLKLEMNPSDLYEEKEVCENNQCHKDVSERNAFNIYLQCWPDIESNVCKAVVKNCGSDSVFVEQGVIHARANRTSMRCLQRNKNVEHMGFRINPELDNYEGHESININALQDDDAAWIAEFKNTTARESGRWMLNFDYTGEGIDVGVYDLPIDFSHPAFRENGLPRRADGLTTDGDKPGNGHGTHVAGIIGGNGALSNTFEKSDNYGPDNYKFRGVAPKVKFYSYEVHIPLLLQKGHVVNHSHVFSEDSRKVSYDGKIYDFCILYYGRKTASVDNDIFWDWKLNSDLGDQLTKTLVATAGNFQNKLIYSEINPLYVTKLSNQTKNPIIVGSYNQSDRTISVFSNRGPTLDGRLKPDVIAPGDGPSYLKCNLTGEDSREPLLGGAERDDPDPPRKEGEEKLELCKLEGSSDKRRAGIISAIPKESNGLYDVWYGPKSGTSQAAPFVTGIAALMYQKFHKKTNLSLSEYSMRNSTVKALLIHSADFYKEGKPSFTAGWGYVNAQEALALIDKFDPYRKEFDKFREFEIYNTAQRRWNIQVTSTDKPLRVSLAWDDAPGDGTSEENKYDKKLVNDLDLFLISPTGAYYYPWKIETSGDKTCAPSKTYLKSCFDRFNNVEVVDVKTPEVGQWQVVVVGNNVVRGNNKNGAAQIASIVSDWPLLTMCPENIPYDVQHSYNAGVQHSCYYDLGDNLENYVTFDERTSLGSGDFLYLYDGNNRLIGIYSGNSLAGKKIIVKNRWLNIIIESDNDNSQGWGYAIKKIEHLSYGALQPLFDMGRRKK